MAIRPGVARGPRVARAALPGSRWIMTNVRIMRPTTTAAAWPTRRSRYLVMDALGGGEVPDLRVLRRGERVERREPAQVALVHEDERRVRDPQPRQLARRVILVGEERLGAGAVLGGVDEAVHLRVGVTALVVEAAGVEEPVARRVEPEVGVVAKVDQLPAAGRRRVRGRGADAHGAGQRVERLGFQGDLDSGLRLGGLDGGVLLIHAGDPRRVDELEAQRLARGDAGPAVGGSAARPLAGGCAAGDDLPAVRLEQRYRRRRRVRVGAARLLQWRDPGTDRLERHRPVARVGQSGVDLARDLLAIDQFLHGLPDV